MDWALRIWEVAQLGASGSILCRSLGAEGSPEDAYFDLGLGDPEVLSSGQVANSFAGYWANSGDANTATGFSPKAPCYETDKAGF